MDVKVSENANVHKYFMLARERELIKHKKLAGFPRSFWTNDSIFANNRFCNVHREDDKTTIWFRENIRDRLNTTYAINPQIILAAIVAFRWFNRIETWDRLLGSSRTAYEDIFSGWNSAWVRQHLIDHGSAPYVTGAYIIKTPDGMNKTDGVLWCIDRFCENILAGKFNKIIQGKASQQEAQGLLEQSPYLGRFMAYQIIADARFTKLLDKAPDIMTWAQPGPGSTRGIGRIFYNDPDKFSYGSSRDEKEVIKLMQELLAASKELGCELGRPWEMQVIQNWCCEYSKYCVAEEGGRMKRKYP